MADSTQTSWIRTAIASQLLMLIYFTIDNHVSLYPWNNLRCPVAELPSTLSGWIPFLLIMLAFAFRVRWGMLAGTIYTYVWLLLQIRDHSDAALITGPDARRRAIAGAVRHCAKFFHFFVKRLLERADVLPAAASIIRYGSNDQ